MLFIDPHLDHLHGDGLSDGGEREMNYYNLFIT